MSHPLPTSMQHGGIGQPALDSFAKTLTELRRLTDFVNADLDADLETREALTAAEERLDEFDVQAAGMRRGLRIIQSPTSPQTDFTIKLQQFALSDGETVLKDISVLIDVGDVGAGGVDVGPITPSEWHYAHICHDPTGAMSPDTVGVISLSPTPTLPTGYTLSGLVDPVPFILTDTDGELVAFSHIPNQNTIMYYAKEDDGATASIDLVTGGGVWHEEDVSALVPPGVSGAWLYFRYDGSPGAPGDYPVYIRPNWGSFGDGTTSQRHLFSGNGGNDYFGPYWIPLDEDGKFLCRPTDDGSNPPTFKAWMVGIQLGSVEV